ncbi:uncharacterized protein LOC131674920 [Phymastichus coffea]|uniref:uncharacterized protein LOC131674920 n=1 Tax=Phymastichus coffea TaxID=108790 RepID=UPI00273C719C|nr:uncharacterized protein LOC131674920 [Phymastichus coffea]
MLLSDVYIYSDGGLAESEPARAAASMTAINSGPVGEVGGVRLPLQSLHGYGSLFMYSATTSPGGAGGGSSSGTGSSAGSTQVATATATTSSTGEVTLRLREPEDIPEEVLARLEDTATLSISLQGDAVLRLGAASAVTRELALFEIFNKKRRRVKEGSCLGDGIAGIAAPSVEKLA